MQVNIDEYDMEHYCWQCGRTLSQPRVVITMSLDRALDGQLRGEVHLHKTMDISCDGSPMIADRKNRLITSSFDIADESQTTKLAPGSSWITSARAMKSPTLNSCKAEIRQKPGLSYSIPVSFPAVPVLSYIFGLIQKNYCL